MKRSSASTSIRRVSSASAARSLVSGLRKAPTRSARAATALAVGGDVLDLVGDRAAVGLAQVREARRRASLRERTCAGSSPGSGPSSPASGRAPRGRAPGRPRARSRAGRGAPRGGRGCAASDERVRGRWPPAAAPRSGRLGRLSAAAGAAAAADGAGAAAARAHAERREDVLVEATLAARQRLDARQEATRLRALDDPVVVGRGQRHDLLRADLRADLARGPAGRRSSRSRRSCPGRASAAVPRRPCPGRRGW
jgi:hypothetical protein